MSRVSGIAFEVFGRVQGVGFRAFTAREASKLELDGWVRNRPDGAVEGVAVGPPEHVAIFVERLRTGPVASEVAEVLYRPDDVLKCTGFTVRW